MNGLIWFSTRLIDHTDFYSSSWANFLQVDLFPLEVSFKSTANGQNAKNLMATKPSQKLMPIWPYYL